MDAATYVRSTHGKSQSSWSMQINIWNGNTTFLRKFMENITGHAYILLVKHFCHMSLKFYAQSESWTRPNFWFSMTMAWTLFLQEIQLALLKQQRYHPRNILMARVGIH